MLKVELSSVFTGELAVGEHSFVWQKPVDLPSGMYECVVRIGETIESTPIIIQP